MLRFLKSGFIIVLVIAICWAGTIAFWRYQGANPSWLEIGLLLAVLPATLLLGLFLYSRKAKANEAGADDSDGSQATAPAFPYTLRQLVALDAGGVTSLADNPGEMLAVLKEPPMPALDPQLRDSQGFPIQAARIPNIDSDSLLAQPDDTGRPLSASCPEHCARAVEALRLACLPLLMKVHILADIAKRPTWTTDALRVQIILPAHWSDDALAHAHRQLTSWLADLGLAQASATFHRADPGKSALDLSHETAFLLRQNAEDSPMLFLLASCDSFISEAQVQSLDDRNMIHTAQNAKGLVPGEGAGALLLMLQQEDDDPLPAELQEAVMLSWIKPDDDTPAQARTARAQAEALFKALPLAPDDVASIVGAAGHNKAAQTALYKLANQQFPKLDPAEDLCVTGNATGWLGCAGSVLSAALAAKQTAASGKTSLYISQADGSNTFLGVAHALAQEPV
jgi:hypothetical protein